jgi:hypothetical protein
MDPIHGEVYSTQNYVIKFVSNLWQVVGFLRVLRCHDITEILLKVALNTINQTRLYHWCELMINSCFFHDLNSTFAVKTSLIQVLLLFLPNTDYIRQDGDYVRGCRYKWKRFKLFAGLHELVFNRGNSSLECFNWTTQNYRLRQSYPVGYRTREKLFFVFVESYKWTLKWIS